MKRYLPMILVLTLLLAGAVVTLFLWPQPDKASSGLALLGFAATLVLVGVTWVYVITSRDTLRHLEREASSRYEVQPAFSLRVDANETVKIGVGSSRYKDGHPIYLDIWNLGRPTFKVTRVDVREANGRAYESLPQGLIVRENDVQSVPVTHALMRLASDHPQGLVNVTDQQRFAAEFDVEYHTGREIRQSGPVIEDFTFFVSDDFINTRLE